MSVAKLLDRLEGVKPTGAGRWIAKCPAHEDRSPSLSIRETDAEIVLLRCWAGCGAADVVGAVGIEFKDLFPERPSDHRSKPTRAWLDARDALCCLATEGTIVAIAAQDYATRQEFTLADVERVSLAAGRIRAAWEMVNGRR